MVDRKAYALAVQKHLVNEDTETFKSFIASSIYYEIQGSYDFRNKKWTGSKPNYGSVEELYSWLLNGKLQLVLSRHIANIGIWLAYPETSK